MGLRMGRPSPRAFDEYLRAYSVAMLPGRERENLSYGGKSACPVATACGQLTLHPLLKLSCHHLRWLI